MSYVQVICSIELDSPLDILGLLCIEGGLVLQGKDKATMADGPNLLTELTKLYKHGLMIKNNY